jgi:hypothetical protein
MKLIAFLAAIFTLWIISPIGKIFTDAVTTNYTFTLLSGNLSNIAWYVAYMRGYWWIMPLVLVVALIVWFIKKDEPEIYAPEPMMPVMTRQPRMPRQVKQPKQRVNKQKPNPPIFFGR